MAEGWNVQNITVTVSAVLGMLIVTAYAVLQLADQQAVIDEQRQQIERQAEEIERIAPRLAACQDAAEVAEELNDNWHAWAGDESPEHTEAVEAAQDQLMHLLKQCRGETAEPTTTEGVAV